MERITKHLKANEQLLYFTSSSLSLDDQYLYFISDRTGSPNIFHLHIPTGEEQQLTFNEEGVMQSYVYFDGQPHRGLGKASAALHPGSGTVYAIMDNVLHRFSNGESSPLWQIPDDQVTAFTHVSRDNRFICVPTTDARAFEGTLGDDKLTAIDARVQNLELSSYLNIIDSVTGEVAACEEVPRCWVTHAQFNPADPFLILYNHEWPSDCGIRRMWLWNGKTHKRLRGEQESSPAAGGYPRQREDWVCHEMWSHDGKYLVYHGGYSDGPFFVGSMKWNGGSLREIPLPDNYRGYGHFTISRNGLLVSDGYYSHEPSKKNTDLGVETGEWLSLQLPDWSKGDLQWKPLCRHGSSWDSQDSHPHPIFSQDGRAVYFTSDWEGTCQVYRAALDAFLV
ncbi:MAG: oligogalacturonate lyase family protein [Spirochaetia bacterium]